MGWAKGGQGAAHWGREQVALGRQQWDWESLTRFQTLWGARHRVRWV